MSSSLASSPHPMPRVFSLALLLRQRSFWIISALLSLFSLLLAALPLTGVLGLEYSLFFGALSTVLLAHLTLRGVWLRADLQNSPEQPSLWGVTMRLWAANGLALLPALAIICANALRVKNCNWSEGFAYFALLPGLGSLVALALGMGMALLPSRRWGVAGIYLLPLATIVWLLGKAYFHPPIFAYNPFFGFFPGSLYDEHRPISQTLLLYRALNLAWVVFFLSLFGLFAGRRGLIGRQHYAWREAAFSPDPHHTDGRIAHTGSWESTLATLSWGVVAASSLWIGYLQRHHIGFTHTNASIQRALGGRLETSNFILYYDKESLRPADLERIARDHEFRHHQLVRYFGYRPKQKVESYLFETAAQKNRFMGAEQTMIARPWAHQIYLHGTYFPHDVLKHELAHVFSEEFGEGPLRLAVQYGLFPLNALVEGIAVAADWERGSLNPHQWCKAMLEKGWKIDPAAILGPTGFFKQSSALSYRVAGSFSRYLIDTYGMERYKRAYGRAEFERVYKKTLAALSSEWKKYLQEKIHLTPADRQIARYAFLTFRSIFARVCPHEVAALRQRIGRATQRRRLGEAIALQERLCRIDTHPYNQHRTIQLLIDAKRYNDAASRLEAMLQRFDAKQYPLFRSDLLQSLAMTRYRQGRQEDAKRLLESIPIEDLPLAHQRTLWIRRYALRHPHLTATVLNYIDGKAGILPLLGLQRLVLTHPHDATLRYLLARRLYNGKHHHDAQKEMAQAAKATHLPLSIRAEILRLQGHIAFSLGHYKQAQAFFLSLQELAPQLPSNLLAQAKDWQERARWEAQTYGQPPEGTASLD